MNILLLLLFPLLLLVPARAQVAKTPLVEASIGAAPGALGAAGTGASLQQAGTVAPLSLNQNSLALPSPAQPSVALPPVVAGAAAAAGGAVAVPAAPAKALAAPRASVPARFSQEAGGRSAVGELADFGDAAEGAPGGSPALAEGADAVLAGMFDGSQARLDSSSPLFSRFEPAVYDRSRVADGRYAAVLDRAWKDIAVQGGGRQGRAESRDAQALDALLERMRETDPPTYAHMLRVGLFTAIIAQRMGFSKADAKGLAWAAALHDIGKGDPEILAAIRKTGKLTPRERDAVNRHPAEGARLIEGLKGIPPSYRDLAASVARNHHEKFDGSGYPNGLKGREIPLSSRIIAVADVFDALMEDRPYRPGMSWEQASAIMREMAPGHFDPEVFGAFLAVTEKEAPVLAAP